MLFNENNRQNEQDERSAEKDKATGYRADDNEGTEEKDLKGNPLFGRGEMREVREGQPMGGQSFGQDGNPTPTGDDKDNPSRNAGYTNGYFARTKPSEEYTADNNFKSPDQQGSADYDKAQPNVAVPHDVSDQPKVGEDTGRPMAPSAKQDDEEQDHIET